MHARFVAQLCPTFCDPTDCSPSGSSVHGILRQEYWSGLPCPPPGDLPSPGIKPRSPALQVDSLPTEPPGKPRQRVTAGNSGGFDFKGLGPQTAMLC